ncbi:EamA family transporter [Dyella choica]|uniref:4-amino-4-deoxy-L-arabinose-phospho-UDP flippase n=1 Tax=Dyella choica TaxID=1927959 RepID=A0A3S0Q3K1_9GAMM|nr:4-amino-4-deoxy-L-arabinose-phospho-UDP flippase [Dyella choica]
MNFRVALATLSVVFSLAVGQLLFKSTALAWATDKNFLSVRVMFRLVPSLIVYAIATLAWIWVLRTAPLKTVYPFMALAFVIVPIGSAYFFGERVTLQYWMGAALIMCGVIITGTSN